MSVVFQRSSRKMTFRSSLLVLLVTTGWLESTKGAAFSNVVVRRDGVVPVEYFIYDPTSSYGVPKAAQLAVPPLESVVQVPPAIVTPCLAPCIVPGAGQGLPPIPPTSNAKIITFNPAPPVAPVPVVVTNKEAARGYQYAYSVYDDNTGDKKSQSEQSDGSVVQGQYSFIQPDGSRREVVYTADDLKGFNAVVKNILPVPEQPKETKEEIKTPQPTPCPEPKNTQLAQIQEQSNEKPPSEAEDLQEPKSKPKSIEKTEKNDVKPIEEKEPKKEKSKEKVEKSKPKPLTEESQQPKEAIDTSFPLITNFISYNDIIKCLQSKLISANTAVSPLTYILIPSSNGPC